MYVCGLCDDLRIEESVVIFIFFVVVYIKGIMENGFELCCWGLELYNEIMVIGFSDIWTLLKKWEKVLLLVLYCNFYFFIIIKRVIVFI